MKKTYFYNVAIGAILVLASFLAVTIYGPLISAENSSQAQQALPATGGLEHGRPAPRMGDLRRFEDPQSLSEHSILDPKIKASGALESRLPEVGMGDLHRFEAQQAKRIGMGDLHRFEAQQQLLPNTGAQESSQNYYGRGDYQLYEEQLSRLNCDFQVSSGSYAGMGDLRRFEFQQEAQQSGGDCPPSP